MFISLSNILEMKIFSDSKIYVSEKSLGKIVENVSYFNPFDNISPPKTGQLHLVTGDKHVNECLRLPGILVCLAEQGGTGLIICPETDINPVDLKITIDLADSLELPLIIMPLYLKHDEIMLSVMEKIINFKSQKFQFMINLQDSIMKILRQSHNVMSLISSLCQLINRPALFLDISDKQIVNSMSKLSIGQYNKLKQMILSNKDFFINSSQDKYTQLDFADNRFVLLSPVIFEGKYYGVLVIFDIEILNELDRIIIKHIKNAIATVVVRRASLEEISDSIRNDFLYDFLNWEFKHENIAVKRGDNLGYDIKRIRNVIIADIDHFSSRNAIKSEHNIKEIKQRFMDIVYMEAEKENNKNFIMSYSDKIVVFVYANEVNTSIKVRSYSLGRRIIKNMMQTTGTPISVGIGEPINNISYIHDCYHTALQALDICKRFFGEQSCLSYEDLRFYNILYDFIKKNDARQLLNNIYAPLREYDLNNDSDLYMTLIVLFDEDLNTNTTAKRLYVHKNTVLHRKEKIKEILGVDPFSKGYKLQFEIASYINKVITD